MNYLCDTHILLWSCLQPNKLSAAHQTILAGDVQKFISTVSLWEISLKFTLGKLNLYGHTPEEFLHRAQGFGYQVISPTAENLTSCYRLPMIDGHKDPFDRMLVWQSIQDNLTLLSHDRNLSVYKAHGLRVV